ncbi:hypothetical protein QFZ34_002066 [Phyllobacterium ifriqiyense]|uniref:Collagen-like protein n=1 Tax=Phyllobacterium ifriqiyense TaxID=314238 RepID=A0ABU0S806_9HYPH|nr:hypothetical protein [Phyllobacterium ifriqiyense]MDQ0996884.1 hypothetical protein [Phyllobacterium ifriqiyense]
MNKLTRSFTDAATDAVARAIATVHREGKREQELRESEHRARMAELETRLAAVAALEAQVTQRLETLKDGERGPIGEDGPEGPQGERGLPGEPGVAGERGEPGRDGVDGSAGERGPEGPQGERGLDGKDGERGLDGPQGEPGERGLPGERGPEGPAGKLPQVRDWSDAIHYESDVVAFGGSTYQAIRDTAKQPPHEDWICLASSGSNGADGRSFQVRGTWVDGTEYNELDVVAVNGASFVARRDNPGECPGADWQLIASQGKRGSQGERGLTGQKGERGEAGMPVVAIDVDDDGLLTLTNGDGSFVRCDLYPLLAKVRP